MKDSKFQKILKMIVGIMEIYFITGVCGACENDLLNISKMIMYLFSSVCVTYTLFKAINKINQVLYIVTNEK